MEETRICRKCNVEKPISEYELRKYNSGNYGYAKACKACDKERDNKYKDPIKNRERYLNNRDNCIANSRRWQEKNLEKVKLDTKKYKEVNKDKYKQYNHKWNQDNKDKVQAYQHKRRALLLNTSAESYSADSICRMYQYQKGSCACCGAHLNNKYEIDHIYPLSKGGTNCVTNIQLLCKSCNCIKGNKTPYEFLRYIKTMYPERYNYYFIEQHGLNTCYYKEELI